MTTTLIEVGSDAAMLFEDRPTVTWGRPEAVHTFTSRADAERWAAERGLAVLDNTKNRDMS